MPVYRVLWFTNIPLPAVQRYNGLKIRGGGHWMSTLLEAIKDTSDVRLAVTTAYPGLKDAHFVEDGVEYFVLGQPKRVSQLTFRRRDLRRCASVVNEWQPDLVHIHGTERFYGLLSTNNLLNVPVVISLQGLRSQIRRNYFGSLSPIDILRAQSLRAIVRGRGLIFDYIRFWRAANQERKILASACNFIGRTHWDRAHVKSINPDARYYHVNELIRPEFHQKTWSIEKASRYSIIFTNAQSPLRDVETILEAVSLLRLDFPSIKLRLAGHIDFSRGYGRFIRQRISRLQLNHCVELLGFLEAQTVVDALCGSHVFCIASYVENSPNSLCEAQLIGMPCVASYAGGIPSLIDEGRSGLFFPPGDSAVLSSRINDIFASDRLAITLGTNARKTALKRHDSNVIITQLLEVYNTLLS